ncbi:hypothetical protein GBA52_028445 [Prunus armeniaca]|nr:hypothetical protein GBA52_028445 [Prunus armeniaca]
MVWFNFENIGKTKLGHVGSRLICKAYYSATISAASVADCTPRPEVYATRPVSKTLILTRGD